MDDQLNIEIEDLSKKERRQLKKEKKQNEYKHEQNIKNLKRYAIITVSAMAVVLGVYGISRLNAPAGEDFSHAIPLMEEEHIQVGSPLPEYTSDPPTSGPHYGQTARSGFRNEEIPDQNVIHNLEHGDIWISFNPRVSDDVIDVLKKFAATKVIITPRKANETDIVLAAWGRLDTFDLENGELPEGRVKDFIKRYSNKGPERVQGASGGI